MGIRAFQELPGGRASLKTTLFCERIEWLNNLNYAGFICGIILFKMG